MANQNTATLNDFIDRTDPKQFALVGLHALGVLADMMTVAEFSAFLHDAAKVSEQHHVQYMGDRTLTQRELNQVLRSGKVQRAVKVDDETARVIGKDGSSLGKFKTKLPFVTTLGEQK